MSTSSASRLESSEEPCRCRQAGSHSPHADSCPLTRAPSTRHMWGMAQLRCGLAPVAAGEPGPLRRRQCQIACARLRFCPRSRSFVPVLSGSPWPQPGLCPRAAHSCLPQACRGGCAHATCPWRTGRCLAAASAASSTVAVRCPADPQHAGMLLEAAGSKAKGAGIGHCT